MYNLDNIGFSSNSEDKLADIQSEYEQEPDEKENENNEDEYEK